MNDRYGSLVPGKAVVLEKVFETDSVCSLTIAPAGGEDFRFRPGQFNMLGLPGFGEAPFSFSTLMLENNAFMHTVRRAGTITKALFGLSPGDSLHLRGPYGNGWPIERTSNRPVILVAGGIGMAPMRSVLYRLFEDRTDCSDVFLLVGGRDEHHLLFRKELDRWRTSNGLTILLSVDRLAGDGIPDVHVGLVTDLLDEPGIPARDAVTFMCGPEIMMRFVAERLIEKGQKPEDIFISMERRMKCGAATCGHCQIGSRYVCRDGPVFSYADMHGSADTLL